MQSSFIPNEPDHFGSGKRKRKRPYVIEWRWIPHWPDWAVWKRYETAADREKAFANITQSCSIEYRIVD